MRCPSVRGNVSMKEKRGISRTRRILCWVSGLVLFLSFLFSVSSSTAPFFPRYTLFFQFSSSSFNFFSLPPVVPSLGGTMVQNSHESRHKYRATCASIRFFARTLHSFTCSTLLALLAHSAAFADALTPKRMIMWLFYCVFFCSGP